MLVEQVKDGLTIEETSEGVTASQPYIVTDIPSTGKFPMSAVLSAPGLPPINDPFGQFDIIVLKRTVATDATLVNGAMVTVEYGFPDSSEVAATASGASERIEMKVGTITEKTLFDVNGEFIRVSYRGTDTGGALFRQVQEAEVQRPVFRFTVRRNEPKIPFQKGQEFTGKVNLTPFSVFDPKTLLLLGIANSETNKGISQEVTYELVWKADSWLFQAQIILGGRLPEDAQLGNGLEVYDVFEAIDFAGLGLAMKI